MAIVAIPNYMPVRALADASPGLRFGMYLELWEAGSFRIPPTNKYAASTRVCELKKSDVAMLKALRGRQDDVAKTVTPREVGRTPASGAR